ncbi:hypothetical protein [Paenibacillus silvae]|uniref:Uncharacterized protein n=1 Tax=Paenibacillus silvae TaxID=1325358 RepID=A0A2W6NNF7_9BACL|nr:hypothetical protein [Paenibacillus silvae]PZT57367.1 hypothetical protein DN757_01545 [Paenibacillus silvae]
MKYEEDKRYYHLEYCHSKYLKLKTETAKENQEWDKLYQYIIKLHDILLLPKGNITRLKDLRAGYEVKQGKRVRKWRTGPDFGLMLEAYKLAESVNRTAINTKIGQWADIQQVNYTITTMLGYLNDAYKNRQNKAKQVSLENRVQALESKKDQNLKNNYKPVKKNDELDISEFL